MTTTTRPVASASTDLETVRDRVKAEARTTVARWYDWLEQADATRITGVPRKVRSVAGRMGRQSGEHDALDQLHPLDVDRLRDSEWILLAGTGRTTSAASSADVTLETVADCHHLADIDAAWREWLHATRCIDAAGAVALGRRPGRWAEAAGFRWAREVAPCCEADGVDVAGVLARDETSAGVTPSADDRLAAYLARLVHAPKAAYARAYADSIIAGTDPPPAPDRPWAPKVAAKVTAYLTTPNRKVAA